MNNSERNKPERELIEKLKEAIANEKGLTIEQISINRLVKELDYQGLPKALTKYRRFKDSTIKKR